MRSIALTFALFAGMASGQWVSATSGEVDKVSTPTEVSDVQRLELARTSGDLDFQRHHMWALFASLVQPLAGTRLPAFSTWMEESETFARHLPVTNQPRSPFPGSPVVATSARDVRLQGSGDAPLISFIHFNPSAYRHIRDHQLFQEGELERLRFQGRVHETISGSRSIPPLPRDAMVVMTAWWPISGDSETPMPVWDPEGKRRSGGSNSYVNWSRVLAVVPHAKNEQSRSSQPLAFAGRSVVHARRVSLDRFYHTGVSAEMAGRLMSDPDAAKAAFIALGRSLRAGDFIAMVGLHVMSAGLPSGIWGTFWWHDRPMDGPYASDRPDHLAMPWQQYLMDVAFDAVLPREADGSPNVCFNPWLDGGLGDGGHGNGLKANCVSCHSRASYPLVDFLPVTRGAPDLIRDRAYQAGQLRTGQLWSLANATYKSF